MQEVLVMERMHWSWPELRETPAEVVEDILTMMEKESKHGRQTKPGQPPTERPLEETLKLLDERYAGKS